MKAEDTRLGNGADMKAIKQMLAYFYQTFHITGQVMLSLTMRQMPDSDGCAVIDASLTPLDHEADKAMGLEGARHLEILADDIPIHLVGYYYRAAIATPSSDGSGQPDIELFGFKEHALYAPG